MAHKLLDHLERADIRARRKCRNAAAHLLQAVFQNGAGARALLAQNQPLAKQLLGRHPAPGKRMLAAANSDIRLFPQQKTIVALLIEDALQNHKIQFPRFQPGQQAGGIVHQKLQRVAEEIVKLVKYRLPKAYNQPLSNIQVLTPMQRSVVGAANLNMLLQQALNTTTLGISRGGTTYKLGDRVMQIRNNYDKNVYNGDIGTVEKVNIEDRTLCVNFDNNLVEYEATELDELTLAYASTIHKSQGSEYPIVVIPVLMTHFVMLQRNLIYTGITRAKKICVLIGQPKALAYAIRNLTVINRNTKLKERLREEIEANNDSGLHISSRYILPEEQPMMAAEPEPNPDITRKIK